MRRFQLLRGTLGSLLLLCLVGLPASAEPIFIVSPEPLPAPIALSPTQTVITFAVDPNGTEVDSVLLTLSALASGLDIVSINPGAGFNGDGPVLVGGNEVASFTSDFSGTQTAQFTIGTVTLLGNVPNTSLVASIEITFFDGAMLDSIDIGPSNVATVVPEPTSAALLSVGILVLAGLRRERLSRSTPS